MPLVAHRPFDSFTRLREEGQEILNIERAQQQDIRELHIGLLNMMPDEELQATEQQFLRLIGSSNRIAQFYVHIFTVAGIERSVETQSYIDANYERFEDIASQGLDALIVTGTNSVHDSTYDKSVWKHTKAILDWADQHVTSVLHSCLATHAALQYFYGIERQPLDEKLYGIFSQRVLDKTHPLLANINTRFDMPHSRLNEIDAQVLKANNISVLVSSEESGVALASSADGIRRVYFQGHPEYDVQSLLKEYQRDLKLYFAGEKENLPKPPKHYLSEFI